MLVISRKPDQSLKIGHDITITVKQIRGKSRVVLGIMAPDGMKVERVNEPVMESPEN